MVLSSKRPTLWGKSAPVYFTFDFCHLLLFRLFPLQTMWHLENYQKRVSCLKGIQLKEKHLLDVIFHFSKFHKAICRSVDCEDLFWKTGRFYHICRRGKTQISHFSTLDGSELIFCQYFGTKYWVWKMPCLQKKISSQTDGNEKITGILLEEMIQKWLFTHKDN